MRPWRVDANAVYGLRSSADPTIEPMQKRCASNVFGLAMQLLGVSGA